MSRRYSVNGTTLRSATRCSRLPAPGLEDLSILAPTPVPDQVLARAPALSLAPALALVLAGEVGEFEEIHG